MRTKVKIIGLLCVIFLSVFLSGLYLAFAYEVDTVDEILSQINLSELEKLYENLGEEEKQLLGFSLKDFISKILNGETVKSEGVIQYFITLISASIKDVLPGFFIIFATLLISSILSGIKPDFANKSISNVIGFASVCLIGSTLCFSLLEIINKTVAFIKTAFSLTQIIFPLIFSVLVTMGASVSVGILQGSISLFLTIISSLLTYFIIPIALASAVLSVVTNMGSSLNLNKIPSFMNSFAKTTVNVTVIGLSALIALQGISVQAYDNVGIRIAKFSLSKYIPILGGYLSSGFDYLYTGSVIVKNSLGVAFLLLLFIMVLPVILRLICLKILLELLSTFSATVGNTCVIKMMEGVKNSVALIITSVVWLVLSLSFFVVMFISFFNSLS